MSSKQNDDDTKMRHIYCSHAKQFLSNCPQSVVVRLPAFLMPCKGRSRSNAAATGENRYAEIR